MTLSDCHNIPNLIEQKEYLVGSDGLRSDALAADACLANLYVSLDNDALATAAGLANLDASLESCRISGTQVHASRKRPSWAT